MRRFIAALAASLTLALAACTYSSTVDLSAIKVSGMADCQLKKFYFGYVHGQVKLKVSGTADHATVEVSYQNLTAAGDSNDPAKAARIDEVKVKGLGKTEISLEPKKKAASGTATRAMAFEGDPAGTHKVTIKVFHGSWVADPRGECTTNLILKTEPVATPAGSTS